MLTDKYFSLSQVAELKGFSTAHLRRLILTGKLKAEKLGKTWVIDKKDINRLKRQRTPRINKKDD